jgi:hypothetical protein
MIRFIHKNGRVIPLRDKFAAGVSRGAMPGAIATGAYIAAGTKAATGKINPFEVAFWALKGATAGGAAGGILNAGLGKKAPALSSKHKQEIKDAFKSSFALSALGSAARISKPFVGKRAPVLRAISTGVFTATHLLSTTNAFYLASKASKGNRGRVLAAGALGDVAGTNLTRIGGPIARNRRALGLKRIF